MGAEHGEHLPAFLWSFPCSRSHARRGTPSWDPIMLLLLGVLKSLPLTLFGHRAGERRWIDSPWSPPEAVQPR